MARDDHAAVSPHLGESGLLEREPSGEPVEAWDQQDLGLSRLDPRERLGEPGPVDRLHCA